MRKCAPCFLVASALSFFTCVLVFLFLLLFEMRIQKLQSSKGFTSFSFLSSTFDQQRHFRSLTISIKCHDSTQTPKCWKNNLPIQSYIHSATQKLFLRAGEKRFWLLLTENVFCSRNCMVWQVYLFALLRSFLFVAANVNIVTWRSWFTHRPRRWPRP